MSWRPDVRRSATVALVVAAWCALWGEVSVASIAVDLPPSSVRHHLLIVVAVTLTPGTAVVETDPRSGTVYVHLLHVDGRAAVTRHIEELAAVADRALPERTDAGGAAP